MGVYKEYSTSLYTPIETSRAQLLLDKPIKSAINSYDKPSSPKSSQAHHGGSTDLVSRTVD